MTVLLGPSHFFRQSKVLKSEPIHKKSPNSHLEIGFSCDVNLAEPPRVVLVASPGEFELSQEEGILDVHLQAADGVSVHVVVELGTCLTIAVVVVGGSDAGD